MQIAFGFAVLFVVFLLLLTDVQNTASISGLESYFLPKQAQNVSFN